MVTSAVWDAYEEAHKALITSLECEISLNPPPLHLGRLPPSSHQSSFNSMKSGIKSLETIERRVQKLQQSLYDIGIRLRHEHARLRFMLAPIGGLPPELLCEIFSYIDPACSRDVLAISHVCHLWRTLTLNMCGLWSWPDFTLPFEAIRIWVQRADAHPLHLKVELAFDSKTLQTSMSLAAFVESHASRCASLTVHYLPLPHEFFTHEILSAVVFHAETFMRAIAAPYLNYGILRQLYIDIDLGPVGVMEGYNTLYEPKFTFLPSLRHLYLRNVDLNTIPCLGPSVETMILDNVLITKRQLCRLLKACPAVERMCLQRLRIVEEEDGPEPEDSDEVLVSVLPKLSALAIQNWEEAPDPGENQILKRLELASLREAVVYTPGVEASHLFKHFDSTITRLGVVGTCVQMSKYLDLMRESVTRALKEDNSPTEENRHASGLFPRITTLLLIQPFSGVHHTNGPGSRNDLVNSILFLVQARSKLGGSCEKIEQVEFVGVPLTLKQRSALHGVVRVVKTCKYVQNVWKRVWC